MPLSKQDINQIIGEITQSAEKDRRQTFRRRGRIYKDGGKDFLIEHITQEFGKDAVNEMRLAPINALKSWVDRKSIIYARPAIRTTELDSDQALLDFYTDVMGFDNIMAKANRYYNLYSNTELYVIPKFKNGFKVPWVNVMPPFLYSVSTGLGDQTKKDVIVFSSFDNDSESLTRKEIQKVSSIQEEKSFKTTGDLVESNEAELGRVSGYIFWTPEQHFTVTNDLVIVTTDQNPEGLNPISKIPSITLRKDVDNEFWAMQGEDMVDMAMATQLGLTDLLSIAKHHGFSIMTVTSQERPQRLDIGLNKTVWLRQKEGQPTPSVSYVQAASPIQEYSALIDRMLEISSTSNLLPSNIFAGSASSDSSSGVHEMMKNAATMMEIESQKPVLRDAELEAWDLIKDWHNLLHDKNELDPSLRALGKFSDQFAPMVTYQDMKPVESEEQRITQVERLLDRGLISKRDAFKKLFPEFTDEQIEAKMKEIEDEKMANAAMFGLPMNKNNAPKEEEELEENGEEGAVQI